MHNHCPISDRTGPCRVCATVMILTPAIFAVVCWAVGYLLAVFLWSIMGTFVDPSIADQIQSDPYMAGSIQPDLWGKIGAVAGFVLGVVAAIVCYVAVYRPVVRASRQTSP